MPRRREKAALAADRAALRAIEEMADYQPVNPAYSIPTLQQIEMRLCASEDAEERARLAYERARLAYEQARFVRIEETRFFREHMRGAKTQVVVQYGDDSYEVHAVGWTRRSDRRRPGRRRATASS